MDNYNEMRRDGERDSLFCILLCFVWDNIRWSNQGMKIQDSQALFLVLPLIKYVTIQALCASTNLNFQDCCQVQLIAVCKELRNLHRKDARQVPWF